MCIRDRDQSDYAKFQAAMEIGDYTSSLQEIINLTENPVSYTHLDVYKRQFLYIKHHSRAVLLVIGIGACVALVFGGVSSCSMMAGSGVGGVFTSSYLSEDADMLAAEAAYCELEQELQYELDHYCLLYTSCAEEP